MSENTDKCGCACNAHTETVGSVEFISPSYGSVRMKSAEEIDQFIKESQEREQREREEELRIRFACAALTGYAATWTESAVKPAYIAQISFDIADAMLAEHKNRSK